MRAPESQVLPAVRKRWAMVMVVAAICVAAAAAYAFSAKNVYESHEQLFVGFQGSTLSDPTAAENAGQFTVQAVQSYVDIVNSPVVTAPVIRSLGLKTTPTKLASKISASVPTNTVLIDLSVSGSSPFAARRLARAVGAQFSTVIQRLDASPTTHQPVVDVTVSSPASLPTSPSAPRKALYIAVALILGLVLGIAAAVGLNRLDTRVHDVGALGDELELALLGAIPDDVAARGDDHMAEALRALRTNLRYVSPDQVLRVILVTSSVPGEGKTTIASGLALAFASTGADVVLIEGDLRRPSVASRLGLVPGAGLATALVAKRPIGEFLQSHPDHPNLRILVAGAPVPNPSELLGSHRMTEVLAEAGALCDVVIVDGPPLLPVTDSALLATQSDGVVVVVHTGRVTRREILGAVDALQKVRARIIGLVANRVRLDGLLGYGYGYAADETASAADSAKVADSETSTALT